jgi:hypothetical protein
MGRAIAWSGGSEPGVEVNPAAVAAMREVSIDITTEFPKPWTEEIVRAADVVVTMGCGDACPIYPGTRYEDWDLDDPEGRDLVGVRAIRDEIGRRVRGSCTSSTSIPPPDRTKALVAARSVRHTMRAGSSWRRRSLWQRSPLVHLRFTNAPSGRSPAVPTVASGKERYGSPRQQAQGGRIRDGCKEAPTCVAGGPLGVRPRRRRVRRR